MTFSNKTKTEGRIIWPLISIIIVTKNNHELATKAVKSILDCDYPTYKREIIVLEETNTPEEIRGSNVEYHTLPVKNLGVGYARNVAMKLTQNHIIVFTDDDCEVEKIWLREIVKPLVRHDKVGAVAGAVLLPKCGPVGECENILGFPGGGVKYLNESKGVEVEMNTFSTCNCAINRNVVGNVNFHEKFTYAGEDELLSRTISKTNIILYNPNAIVRHKPRDSLGGVFNWFLRRGQARWEMFNVKTEKHEELKYILKNSPILRLFLLISICQLIQAPILPVILFVGIAYYISVIYRNRWARKYYKSIKTYLLLPVVKAIMDVGNDIGIVKTVYKSIKIGF